MPADAARPRAHPAWVPSLGGMAGRAGARRCPAGPSLGSDPSLGRMAARPAGPPQPPGGRPRPLLAPQLCL